MGASSSSSDSNASPEASPRSATPPEGDASEKWLVRILLALAFGLAFGIEGMTLVRSFLLEDGPETTQTTTAQPVLDAGSVLVPSTGPAVRVRRMRLVATRDEWTFTLAVRPDTALKQPYTLSFDRLTLDNGTDLTTAPRHTWAPSDTTAFAAAWTLPVGQRPNALTVTATTRVNADSTATVTRTVSFGHVPVRQQ